MEDYKGLVSVIVPIYNMEKYLDRCVQSILRQTYTNLEILLIDDGSTDESLQIMNRYAEQDSRIQVFHKENGGVSSARNLGLDKMRGEYCTFVDPDDYVADVYVEWLLETTQQTKTQMSVCKFIAIEDKEAARFVDNPNSLAPTISIYDVEEYSIFSDVRRWECWGALYQHDLIRNIWFDNDLNIGEDALFFMKVFLKCKRISVIEQKLYVYVQYNSSAYHRPYTFKRWTEVLAWKRITELCCDAKAPLNLKEQVLAWYEMICASMLMQILHSQYNDPDKVKYLIHELRKYRKAIAYIPKEKKSIRIRVSAAVLFPRLTSHLLWYHYQHKGK